MSFDLKLSGGDLVIQGGKLQTVTDGEKLLQDILKMCLTTAGTNPVHPWYGSFLSRTIIGNSLNASVLVQIGKSQLNTCLENLKKLQDLQVKSLQKVSADEQISAISDISIIRNEINPTLYDIRISVLTKGFKTINASFRLSAL
jgi:phage baseplate assembly protein W